MTARQSYASANNRLSRRAFGQYLALGSCLPALGCQSWWRPTCPPPDVAYLEGYDNFSFFLAPQFAQRRPRRIFVIFENGGTVAVNFQRRFAEQIANQFREQRIAEMVMDPQNTGCTCDLETIIQGRFNEYSLLEWTDRYHCDALLVTRVNSLRTYWPLDMSATMAVIDRGEAIVLAAADGHWTAGRADVRRSYESYLRNYRGEVPPESWDVQLRSPSNFESFVAWQMAYAITRNLS